MYVIGLSYVSLPIGHMSHSDLCTEESQQQTDEGTTTLFLPHSHSHCTHTLSHSLTQSLTHSQLLTSHSLTLHLHTLHLLTSLTPHTHSLTRPHTAHSLTYSLTRSLTHSHTHSLTHPFLSFL